MPHGFTLLNKFVYPTTLYVLGQMEAGSMSGYMLDPDWVWAGVPRQEVYQDLSVPLIVPGGKYIALCVCLQTSARWDLTAVCWEPRYGSGRSPSSWAVLNQSLLQIWPSRWRSLAGGSQLVGFIFRSHCQLGLWFWAVYGDFTCSLQ